MSGGRVRAARGVRLRPARVWSLRLALAGWLAAPALAQVEPPGYEKEIWYSVYYASRGAGFAEYYATLKAAEAQTATGRVRWAETLPWSNLRVVGYPVASLDLLDSHPDEGALLLETLGEEAYLRLASAYGGATIERATYVRRYRDDLSLNRDRYRRASAELTMHTLVTVRSGRALAFEELAARVIDAYREVRPDAVVLGLETVLGGGPRYVFRQAFASHAALAELRSPDALVAEAFGDAAAEAFNQGIAEAVTKIDSYLLARAPALELNVE